MTSDDWINLRMIKTDMAVCSLHGLRLDIGQTNFNQTAGVGSTNVEWRMTNGELRNTLDLYESETVRAIPRLIIIGRSVLDVDESVKSQNSQI